MRRLRIKHGNKNITKEEKSAKCIISFLTPVGLVYVYRDGNSQYGSSTLGMIPLTPSGFEEFSLSEYSGNSH